jgi:putative membrane protein
MQTAALVITGIVALLHIYFLVLEMFLWDKAPGFRAFGHTPEQAAVTKTLARNQGLYNGFLAAGLIWGIYQIGRDWHFGFHILIFFLTCVIIAGIFGAVTASRKILFIQALPALIALVLLHFK